MNQYHLLKRLSFFPLDVFSTFVKDQVTIGMWIHFWVFNSSKSVAFLHSKDKQAEKEVREMTPFTIATNNIKYFGVTLTKQVKDLYKNFSSLKKEIKEDLRK